MAKGLEVTRSLAAGIVYSGGDVPLGLPAVVQAAGASRVRLPLSSVEPVYGLDPHVLVGKVNHYLYGQPARSISGAGALSRPSTLVCPFVYPANICVPSSGARRGMAPPVERGAMHEAALVLSSSSRWAGGPAHRSGRAAH